MEDQSTARIKEIKKYLSLDGQDHLYKSELSRPLRLLRSSVEKRINASIKKDRPSDLGRSLFFRNQLKTILLNSDEIRSLPTQILDLDHFKQFESCHILVHEKGKPEGQNFLNSHHAEEEIKSISIQSFNNIYTHVKKSKNKIFNQALVFKNDLDLVGNFLAKEIDLKNHSVICLISRNSFLPPSDEEQAHFLSLCSFLLPVLNRLLDKEKNDFKKEVLIKSLKHFPEKIYIKDQNRIIFTNDKEPDDVDNLSLMSFPLNGNDGLTMELSNLSKESISTDLYHSQRISLLGELLNTLQHELSNPLFGLNLTSSLLQHETSDQETLSTLKDICQNAIRSQTIIKNFSNLYNEQEELKNTNLVSLIEETITLTKSESKQIQKEIKCINFEAKNGLFVHTNPTYLTQIIFNLIINASQAIKNATQSLAPHRIIIELEDAFDQVIIRIIDDGPGIFKEIESDIFRPFFTTKDSGTGLGLSICKNLALELGAEINFKNNSPLPGATFWINLKR